MSDPTDSYNDVPYDSYAFALSHPGRLATVGAMFGMEPCDLKKARVLEVGCAGGGNLVPVAVAYPGGEFVGVEVSPVQAERAREFAKGAGAGNVTILCRGLEGLTEEEAGGKFDYIIAHGVYSWVTEPVREALLELCGRLLRPQGVAYISYNTLPGALTRATVRELLNFHAARKDKAHAAPGGLARVAEARKVLGMLGEAMEEREDGYAQLMMGELTQVAALGDFYLAHEHLEESNDACYFHDFMERSRRHGLQYLGDAEVQTMATGDIPAGVRHWVRGESQVPEDAEQYHDFIRNRAFRQTLLCREGVELKRGIAQEQVHRFHFAASLKPVKGGEAGKTGEFEDAAGTKMQVTDALAAAALAELRTAWPGCLDFWTLLERAAQRTGVPVDGRQAAGLSLALLGCWSASKEVELHVYPPALERKVSEYPRVWAVARWQAAQRRPVTNLRHENLALTVPDQEFVCMVDGKRSLAELEKLGRNVREVLREFGRMGLLDS